jgi:hypothetical protein
MSGFFPGQRVLCIDGSFHASVWEWVNEVPQEGEIYTVASVVQNSPNKVTGIVSAALNLVEIPGRLPGQVGVCWNVRRFAPLDIADAGAVIRKLRKSPKTRPTPVRPKRQPATSPA